MPQTRYPDVTLPRLTRWAKLNMQRWDHGSRPQTMVLVGPPGLGKTVWTKHDYPQIIADYHGISVDKVGVIVFTVADKDEVEISGPALPYKDPKTGKVSFQFSKSPIFKLIDEKRAEGCTHFVLLLDEMAAATPGGQKVIAPMLDPNEHSVGGDPLPETCYVFGTGNRASDKAGSFSFLKHLPNRCKVMNLLFDMKALAKWWAEKELNPLCIEVAQAFVDEGFFAETVPDHDEAYCTPRSLENMSYDLDCIMAQPDFAGTLGPDDRDYLSTTVGRQAADTLVTWINQHDHLPSADDILSSPATAKVPDQTGYQSVAAHIALGAVRDEKAANAALVYIRRLRPDLQVPLLTKLLKECNYKGWTFTSSDAMDFLDQYRDLLPLAYING